MNNELKKIRMTEYMLTAKDFAEVLKVEYSTYKGWESGKSQPTLDAAITVAKKLNRKIEDIWHK